MHKNFFIFVFVMLFISSVNNDNLFSGDEGGQAGAFLRTGLSPRARSMGDTYVAIADNATAAYYNPAGLGYLKTNELQMSLAAMSFDRVFNYLGYSRPLPPMAGFAAGIIQGGFKDYKARLRNGEYSGETIADDHYAFFIGFAIRFSNYVALGLAPKMVFSKVYDVSASSFGADFGLMIKPMPSLSFGAAIKDIGIKMKYTRQASDGLGDQSTLDPYPRIIKTGVAYTLPLSESLPSFLFSGDIEYNAKQQTKIHFGTEANIQNRLWIRAGFDHTDFTAGFALPFRFKNYFFRLDYAYIHDTRGAVSPGSQDFGLSIVF